MSDIYIQKQQELDSYIDELNIIPSKYKEYKEKANDMIDYLLSCIEIKNNEIDKFKTHYKKAKEVAKEQSEEITKLNNVINKLEKEMKDIIKEYEIYTKYDINDIRDLTGSYWYGYSDCADEVLCRIKELKGNNDEKEKQ